MSDSETAGNEGKKKFKAKTDGLFFTFSRPYLDFIGKEKLYSLVYIVMAVINLIIPFAILYQVIDSGFFSFGAKFVFAFIFTWLVIVFACWIGFQLWWDRRKRITNLAASEFIATPVFSEILQTSGEWLGTFIGIIGAGGGLISLMTLRDNANLLFTVIGMGFMRYGAAGIVIGPIAGFFIIVIFRFIAEQLRILAARANNTKEIAANIKNGANSV